MEISDSHQVLLDLAQSEETDLGQAVLQQPYSDQLEMRELNTRREQRTDRARPRRRWPRRIP